MTSQCVSCILFAFLVRPARHDPIITRNALIFPREGEATNRPTISATNLQRVVCIFSMTYLYETTEI